jgi:hypothetical protein
MTVLTAGQQGVANARTGRDRVVSHEHAPLTSMCAGWMRNAGLAKVRRLPIRGAAGNALVIGHKPRRS